MSDGIFNVALGAWAEKFRDGSANGLLLLLTQNEAEAGLVDHPHVDALLNADTPAVNAEATDASYARKAGIVGTITVDNVNDRVDLDMPDQTFSALEGSAITKAVIAYEESASDVGRIPLFHFDFGITPDGSDVTIEFNASGVARAQQQ